MSNRVAADLDELEVAAKALADARDGLGRIDTATPAEQLGTQLAGAETAAAALAVALRLGTAAQIYAARIDEMSKATAARAQEWRRVDLEAADRFHAIGRRHWPC